MNIDLTKLRHLLAVAESQSFSRAAAELHLTQPALSRSIAALEAQVGLKLFDRSRRGAQPTVMGKLVIAEAERLVRFARDVNQNIEAYSQGKGGQLSVGIGPSVALIFPDILVSIFKAAPELNVKISSGSAEKLVSDLLSDRVELIVGSPWDQSELNNIQTEVLGVIQVGVLVRAGHPLTRLRQVTIPDLQSYPTACATEQMMPPLMANPGSIVCDNYYLLRELVLTTDCLWIASPTLLSQDLAEGRLVTVTYENHRINEVEISASWRASRTLSTAATAMIAMLREFLAMHHHYHRA